MELNIYKKPNPSKVFDKIAKFKKLLKPIKVKNDNTFINQLLSKPNEILHLLTEGFSLEDHNYINLNCEIKCNIPIQFGAQVGNGANSWLFGKKSNMESLYDCNDKTVLIELLESIHLPNEIIFTEITLTQKIQSSKSEFKYIL